MASLTAESLKRQGTADSKRKMATSPTHSAKSMESMLDVKNNRKRAEADLQLLANRIALLRAEEQKAISKITETKTRAKEILAFKKRNEDEMQGRMSSNIVKEMEIKAIQSKVNLDKSKQKTNLAFSRKNLAEEKKAQAVELKIEKEKLGDLATQQRLAAIEEKKQRAFEVKRLEDERRKQREKEKAIREQAAQKEYAKRIAEEAKKTEDAENLISMLEKEELELIERLKSAQSLQQKAYSALQTSLDL